MKWQSAEAAGSDTYNPVMTDLAGIDVRSFEPYYQQLRRILVKDIEDRRGEGDLLPSERSS
jgi:hypothetical protein